MWFVAFAAGYVLGARAEKENFDDIVHAARAISRSEEMRDLVAAVRTHAGQALRGLAEVVEHGTTDSDSVRVTARAMMSAEMVDRVRRLIGEP